MSPTKTTKQRRVHIERCIRRLERAAAMLAKEEHPSIVKPTRRLTLIVAECRKFHNQLEQQIMIEAARKVTSLVSPDKTLGLE